MAQIINTIFLEPFKGFLGKLAAFLPNLFTSLVLIITGVILAWILRPIIVAILRFVKIDALAEKLGIKHALNKGGIKEPLSHLSGRFIVWIVIISFLIMGLDALKISAVEDLLRTFLFYLPKVIGAAAVVIVGYMAGNFLGRAALIASVNAGMAIAGLLGKFVRFTVFAITVSMALELLGIGKETVLIAFAIVFGGVVLALALAFGLAGKKPAEKYIEQKLEEKGENDDIHHI